MLTHISNQSKVPQKARAFIVDKSSGHPLPGVVILAAAELTTAEPDDNLKIPLGMLVSDAAGYVSFDLKCLGEWGTLPLKHLWLCAVGDETAKIDLVMSHKDKAGEIDMKAVEHSVGLHPSVNFCFPFWLKVDARLATQGNPHINLPSIQNPDPCDWELSPYSFTTKSDVMLGEAGCAVPVPSTEAEREYRFSQVVRTAIPQPSPDIGYKMGVRMGDGIGLGATLGGQSGAGANSLLIDPVNPTVIPIPATMPITHGEVLEFKQTWLPKSHSLGTILYSLALAPCESVNIAVIDWSREDEFTRTDTIISKESLKHKQKRDRTIDETVDAALNELQGGDSFMAGHGGAASATVPIAGVPVHFGGTHAIGWSASKSWGNRDLTADSGQELHDTIIQRTNVNRSLNSTVVVQATQDESNYLETRTITNHNHCHALTIQYYEVLRHFKVVTEYVRSRRAVLVPYKILDFLAEPDLAQRYRTILEAALLDPKLLPCFDALLRLLTGKGYESSVDAEEGDQAAGKETPSNEPTINAYYLTLESTLKPENWADPEGWILVKLKVGNDWKKLYEKKKKDDGGGTLRRPKHDEVVTTGDLIGIRPSDIQQVKVEWFENGGYGTGDFWDFKGIRIDYTLMGKAGRKKLIDEQGSSEPSKSKSHEHALKWFDESNNNWQEWVGTVEAPARVDLEDVDEPDTTKTTDQLQDAKAKDKPTKAGDEYCYERLITHLNFNKVYYNRAIWLLQDPSERVMMLNAALAAYPELLNSIDTTPMAVSGNYVAFPYNSEPTTEEEEKEKNRLKKNPLRESIVSLPTRGVFAETHLSHCNACEVRDVTRFWQWEESPCERPPTIEGITPGPRGQIPTLQPTALPSPVVQIMQPPAAPDPVGLAAALNLLGQPNIFRDMSGMKELEDLLEGLASGAVDLAKGQQQLEALKKKQEMANNAQKSGGGGAKSSPSESDAGKQVDKINVIKDALDQGLIDKEQAADAVTGVLGGGRPLLASADAGFVPDAGSNSDGDAEDDIEAIELAAVKSTRDRSTEVANFYTGPGFTKDGKYRKNGAVWDDKYWFAKLYEIITYTEVRDRSVFKHPGFVLHFIPFFYNLYDKARLAYHRKEKVSQLWEEHFDLTERPFTTNLFSEYIARIGDCIFTGVKAHIQGDMVNALVAAYFSYTSKYKLSNIPFTEFKPDFMENNRKLFESVPPAFFVDVTRLILPVSPPAGQFLFGYIDTIFPTLSIDTIYEWREEVWQKAQEKIGS